MRDAGANTRAAHDVVDALGGVVHLTVTAGVQSEFVLENHVLTLGYGERSGDRGGTIPPSTATQRLTAISNSTPTEIITKSVSPRFNAPRAPPMSMKRCTIIVPAVIVVVVTNSIGNS